MVDTTPPRVAILAGGRGSRLGGDKPVAELGGRPLIDWPLEAARAAGLAVFVVAKSGSVLPPDLETRGVKVVIEPDEPAHPLAGVLEGLRATRAPIIACACDLPFASPELFRWLAEQDDSPIVAPVWDGHAQSMLARYAPEAIDVLEQAVGDGRSAAWALAAADARLVDASELLELGDPARMFFDVDSPADLLAARSLLESGLPDPDKAL